MKIDKEALRRDVLEERRIASDPQSCPRCKGTGVIVHEVGPASTKSWTEPCGCRATVTAEMIFRHNFPGEEI